jgi:hypothetical protein
MHLAEPAAVRSARTGITLGRAAAATARVTGLVLLEAVAAAGCPSA